MLSTSTNYSLFSAKLQALFVQVTFFVWKKDFISLWKNDILFLFKAGLAQNSSQRTWKLIVVSAGHVAITWRNRKPGMSLLLVERRTRRYNLTCVMSISRDKGLVNKGGAWTGRWGWQGVKSWDPCDGISVVEEGPQLHFRSVWPEPVLPTWSSLSMCPDACPPYMVLTVHVSRCAMVLLAKSVTRQKLITVSRFIVCFNVCFNTTDCFNLIAVFSLIGLMFMKIMLKRWLLPKWNILLQT